MGMSATNERDVAMYTAKTDFQKALVLARSVSQSWFRCQALAGVARYAPEKHVVKTAEEAISAALTATNSYQQVAATAWPFRALIERQQEHTALQLLPHILELSARIENPVSRSDALFLLWEAFFPIQGHQSIFGALVKSCDGHWKADYLLRQIVLIVASENHKEAHKLASSMREGKYKRQAEKRLTNGEISRARGFFHG
jgi:hypothetical protein